MQFINWFSLLKPAYVPESAWLTHGPFAFWIVSELKPRRIVELGSHHGYSFFAFCQAVREMGLKSECYAVDTWEGDEHAGFYGEDVYQAVRQHSQQEYPEIATLLRKTFAEARADIEDGTVDLLHVDGRHLYEDVKEDFETWIPKLSENAVVLFHDTEVRERDFGVWKYWAELEKKYPSFNFHHGHGLGVLGVGQDFPPAVRDLFAVTKTPEVANFIRATYSVLGHAIADQREHMALAARVQKAPRGNYAREYAEFTAQLQKVQAEFNEERAKLTAALEQARQDLEQEREQAARDMHREEVRRQELGRQHGQTRTALAEEKAEHQQLKGNSPAMDVVLAELIDARSHPVRNMARWLSFKVLRFLASMHPPFSARTVSRFARSASKRDPRQAHGFDRAVNEPQSTGTKET